MAISRSGNRAMSDFLRIDSAMGLTFSGMALVTGDPQMKMRLTHVARRAYDIIAKLRQGVAMTALEADRLNSNLQRLRCELEILGEMI